MRRPACVQHMVAAITCLLLAVLLGGEDDATTLVGSPFLLRVRGVPLSSVASQVQLLTTSPYSLSAPGLSASGLGITSIDGDLCAIGAAARPTTGGWNNIVTLDFSNNSIATLPNNMLLGTCLGYLYTLNFSRNLLTGDALTQAALKFTLPQITNFDFSHNPIGASLPAGWGNAAFWTYSAAPYSTAPSIWMKNCSLASLPSGFFQIRVPPSQRFMLLTGPYSRVYSCAHTSFDRMQ